MAELEEIFQPYQAVSRIGDDKIWNVRNQISNPIFKAFVVKMKMRA